MSNDTMISTSFTMQELHDLREAEFIPSFTIDCSCIHGVEVCLQHNVPYLLYRHGEVLFKAGADKPAVKLANILSQQCRWVVVEAGGESYIEWLYIVNNCSYGLVVAQTLQEAKARLIPHPVKDTA